MQGPRASYGKESKAQSKAEQVKKEKKQAGGAVATKVIAASFRSKNFSMVARARSKGHSVVTRKRGSTVSTADIIQQSSRAELGWAVRMQKTKKKKKEESSVYTQNGLVRYSAATRARTSQAVVPVATRTPSHDGGNGWTRECTQLQSSKRSHEG